MTTNIQQTTTTTTTTTGLTNQESTFVAAILSSMAAGNEPISNHSASGAADKTITINNNNHNNKLQELCHEDLSHGLKVLYHNSMFYAEQSMLDPYQDSCRFNHRPRPYEHYSIPSSTSSGGAYASSSTPTTLTPTSLGNLQQAFIELQSVPSSSAASVADPGHSYGGNHSVDPSGGGSYSQYDDSCDEDSSAEPRMVGKIGGKIKEEKDDIMQSLMRNRLCPEEEERRRIRRERNKIAAAKCRQRRVDHTNRLIQETEKLEEERATLQDEIHTLRQQKDQLEFILQAHRPLCKAPAPKNGIHETAHDVKVKTERDLVNSCSGANASSIMSGIKQEGNGDGYYGYTADGGSGGGVGGGSSPTLISL